MSATLSQVKNEKFLSKFDISINSMDASYIPISKAKVFSMNWIIFLISNIVSDISSNIHKFLSPSADIPLQNAQTCKYSFRPPVSAISLSDTDLFLKIFEQSILFQHIQCRDQIAITGTAGLHFLDSILQFNNLSLPWNIHILPALPYCFVDIFHFFCFSVDIFSTCRFF